MPSRTDRLRAFARIALLAVAAAAAASAGTARAQDDDEDEQAAASGPRVAASAAPSTDPRARRVQAALDRLRADPLLSGQHKEHRLRWESEKEKPDVQDYSKLFAWFASLARFLSDTSRFLMWALIAAVAALVLVGLRRVAQLGGWRRRVRAPAAVSHVRDLDVRPESLPDDVGAAAWALWQAGQVPAALSLLYRGALSRLIHRFAVPITASATEGECLDLAQGRLEATALRYVTQVVRAWQASTYGGRALSLAMGEALCSGFGQRLDAATATTGRAA